MRAEKNQFGLNIENEMKAEEINRNYYDANAPVFVGGTLKADVSPIREKFLSYLPDEGRLLDWGCGSGRDTRAFLEAGYQVIATDASKELCRLASEYTGIAVRNERFEDLKETSCFDGIWACASLLHVPKAQLPFVFQLAANALKPGGIMYASFKYGDFEGERNGRYFTDLTEESLTKILDPVSSLHIREFWITGDVREGRENEKWLNAIIAKGSLKLSATNSNRIHALVEDGLASGEMKRYSFVAAEDGKKD